MDAAHPRSAKRRYVAAEERQRAIRACAECRRLKEKCADGIPCRRCRHLRRACEVAPVPAPAERVTPDFAGSLKELMDRLRCMGFILKHHFPDLALDTESLRRTCDALASRTPRLDQHDNTVEWAEPLADARPADSSPGIEDEDCTIDSVDDTTVHYSGEFSHWNFSMHIKRNLDELMAKSNAPSLDNVNQVPEFIRVGEADPGSTSITDIVAIIPPRPVATFLINVFFKHATSIYYFIDRRWLDGFLDLIYNNARELRSKDVTAACVVLMVIAVGTQYVHLESPQKQRRCSTNGPATTNTQGGWELEIGSVFYRQVAKLLSEVIHSGSQLSVQVFLLLGLYYLPLDASGLSYIYLNLAIKIAIQNGMHRNVSRRSFDIRTKEIRRRIWWTSYCMERKIGIYHGRPTSITRSDIDVDLPRSPGANDLNNDSFDCSGLLESIHLTGQAELFLQEISRLRTCAKSEIRTIFNRIKLMKTNLQGRWSPSPTDVPSTSATNQAERPNSRAEIHARLECCLLHMFIGRPFILAHRHVHTRVIVPAASAPPRSKAPEPHVQWTFLVQDCVAAAKEAINLCHSLQTGRMGLAKSSYTEYSSCRASLLVLIAYSICYRTNEFASTLERGLDAIREMASVGDSARSEVSLLEALEAALHRLRVFDPLPDQSIDTADDNSAEEGYAGFLDWYNKLGGPDNSRGGSNHNGNGGQSAKAQQSYDTGPQMGPIISNPGVTGLSSDSSIDTYPFDFDLLNTEGSAAFFTPDFNEHGNPERELFENLLWVPR